MEDHLITPDGHRYVPAYPLLRIYLGIILTYTVMERWNAGIPFVKEMTDYLQIMLSREKMPLFYRDFLITVVIPHSTVFGNLVMAGELAAGIGLLTGTYTGCAFW